MLTVVINVSGQASIGPRGLLLQSYARVRSAISPAPNMRGDTSTGPSLRLETIREEGVGSGSMLFMENWENVRRLDGLSDGT